MKRPAASPQPANPNLGSVQALRNLRELLVDSAAECLHARDGRERHECDEQGVLDEVLTVFLANETIDEILHGSWLSWTWTREHIPRPLRTALAAITNRLYATAGNTATPMGRNPYIGR